MTEIEAHAVGTDQRSFLGNMIAQHPAQGFVRQMGSRMVGAQARTTIMIHDQSHRVSRGNLAGTDIANMDMQAFSAFECIRDIHGAGFVCQKSCIAYLTSGLGIERCLVHDNGDLGTSICGLDLLAIPDQR